MLENDIQVHFIDPIATVLRDPPKDTNWARDLAEKLEGEPITKDVLASCADHLVRQGGKSFPQFKVCLRAIQEALRGQARPATAGASSDRITKDTYHDAAKAFGRRIIIRRDEPIRWSAWRRYYEALGLHWSAKQLGPESTRHEWTVPAEMPSQFDRHWIDPNPSEALPRESFMGVEDRRAQADALMDRLPAAIRPPRKRWGGTSDGEIKRIADDEYRARLADMAEGGLSPEALSRMGLDSEGQAA